jgi:hypothetical protein
MRLATTRCLSEADGPSSAPLSALKFLESPDRDSRGGNPFLTQVWFARGMSAIRFWRDTGIRERPGRRSFQDQNGRNPDGESLTIESDVPDVHPDDGSATWCNHALHHRSGLQMVRACAEFNPDTFCRPSGALLDPFAGFAYIRGPRAVLSGAVPRLRLGTSGIESSPRRQIRRVKSHQRGDTFSSPL